MLEKGLYNHLRNDAGIRTLIGNRLYPGQAPRGHIGSFHLQGTLYPYLTYFRVSTEREYGLSEPTSLVVARVQIDAWSDNYDAAKSLQLLVKAALSGFQGMMLDHKVDLVTLDNEWDEYHQPKSSEESGLYRASGDYLIYYHE